MTSDNAFLGTGWSFPPAFDPIQRHVQMLSGVDDIESSLKILLATALGERVMQPKYGCNLDDMVFEVLDTTLITEMKNRIEVGVLYFESRIDVHSINIVNQNETTGLLLISIDYNVRATNTRSNLVFPFYLSEK